MYILRSLHYVITFGTILRGMEMGDNVMQEVYDGFKPLTQEGNFLMGRGVDASWTWRVN